MALLLIFRRFCFYVIHILVVIAAKTSQKIPPNTGAGGMYHLTYPFPDFHPRKKPTPFPALWHSLRHWHSWPLRPPFPAAPQAPEPSPAASCSTCCPLLLFSEGNRELVSSGGSRGLVCFHPVFLSLLMTYTISRVYSYIYTVYSCMAL